MTDSALTDVVAEFLALVEAHAPTAAARLAVAQLERGYRPEQVIIDLLAPAQAEVGRMWEAALWTVADEHQATAVSDAALHGVVAASVPARSFRGSVAVICAPGDWHTLPSRMAAELLRIEGWEVLFLGGSLPPADLGRWLDDVRPDALVISCSIATAAPGLRAAAAAAAAAGVPVVAGGRGLGPDHMRAAALGVRWAAEPRFFGEALASPLPSFDSAALDERMAEYSRLQLRWDDVVAAAVAALGRLWPPLAQLSDAHMTRTREDFGFLLEFLGASMVTDDPRLFSEFVSWLTVLLTARGLPAAVVPVSLRALGAALPAECAEAADTLRRSQSTLAEVP